MGGGAPIPAEFNEELNRVLGVLGVIGSWGLTEFPIATSCHPTDPADVLANTVGRPSPGVTVRAVLADGTDAGLDVEGELVLHGPQQFLGYLSPELEANAYVDGDWFRTGDLGIVCSDGNIRITGRLKDVIIRNAENISALEVEGAVRGYRVAELQHDVDRARIDMKAARNRMQQLERAVEVVIDGLKETHESGKRSLETLQKTIER